MSQYPNDYVEDVLNDIEDNKGKRRIVDAYIWERQFLNWISPDRLHPNPTDEFSMAEIGPNFSIISDYIQTIKECQLHGLPIFDDPVIVEKIKPGGYMILNGHHRWMAAKRMSVKKLHVKVTNLTTAHDIAECLEKTDRTKRVAFDLDEVLLAGIGGSSEDEMSSWVGRYSINERLRAGTVRLMKYLDANGYDIWIYTEELKSKQYIHSIFKLYGISICGCINGSKRIKMSDEHKEKAKTLFTSQYTFSVNVDNTSVMLVYDPYRDYDLIELKYDNADQWADKVIEAIEANQRS